MPHRCITYLRGEGDTRRLCHPLNVRGSSNYAARQQIERPRTSCASGEQLQFELELETSAAMAEESRIVFVVYYPHQIELLCDSAVRAEVAVL